MGPLISPQAKERVCSLIQSGVDEGASLLLDGRSVKVKGYENGNFVGPTIIGNVQVCGLTFGTVRFTRQPHKSNAPPSVLLASDEVLY